MSPANQVVEDEEEAYLFGDSAPPLRHAHNTLAQKKFRPAQQSHRHPVVPQTQIQTSQEQEVSREEPWTSPFGLPLLAQGQGSGRAPTVTSDGFAQYAQYALFGSEEYRYPSPPQHRPRKAGLASYTLSHYPTQVEPEGAVPINESDIHRVDEAEEAPQDWATTKVQELLEAWTYVGGLE